MSNTQTIKADAGQQVCDVIGRIVQDKLHTAAEVAAFAGVHVSAVYRWTGGDVVPGLGEFVALCNNTTSVEARAMLLTLFPLAVDQEPTGNAEEHLMPSAINLAQDVGKLLRYAAAADGLQIADVSSDRQDRLEMLRLTELELQAIEQHCRHLRECCQAQRDQINSRRAARRVPGALRLTSET